MPLFDVVYWPLQMSGYDLTTTVRARRVEAIDRVHALLWWFRTELGVRIDPVTMFDEPYPTHRLSCGCEVEISFVTKPLGRIARWSSGETSGTTAEVETDACAVHVDEWQDPQWHGTFAAWNHDPGRPDTTTDSA